MKQQKPVEILVGLLMLLGALAFLFLALKVSGLSDITPRDCYYVTADFDNIGGLKARAPVTIAGVKVGEVKEIKLDPVTLRARTVMCMDSKQNRIPLDQTSARILTEGLLGSNYISIEPGAGDEPENKNEAFLHSGSHIQLTNSAIILENLISQFLFSLKDKDKDKK